MKTKRGSNPIHRNIPGAPFKVGQRVRVARVVDETGLRCLVGMDGAVEYFEYDCGCGQSYPEDPMIGVRFPTGQLEEFWHEELRLLKQR